MKTRNFGPTLVFTLGNLIIHHSNQSTVRLRMKGIAVNNYAGTIGKTKKYSGKIRIYINIMKTFQNSHDQIGILIVREL